MKIVDLRTTRHELPLERPIRTAIHDIRAISILLVFVDGGDGLVGESYLFAFARQPLKSFDEMVLSFKPALIGADPEFSEALWQQLWRGINFFGHKGVAVFDLPVSSHIFTEQSLAVMAALGNATYLEHMPWFGVLFREKLEMRDGAVVVPERPGFGFTFDPAALDRYRL